MEHCVEQAIHEVEISAASKRLQVVSFLAPPTRAMHFDRCQLEQVLSNLLDNACKFAHDGGRIEINGYPVSSERRCANVPRIGLERRPGFASPQVSFRAGCNSFESGCNYFRIDVFNTGPAIAPELLDRIFDEYATFVVNGGGNRSIRSAERSAETSPKKSAEKSAERGSIGRAGAGLGLAICKRIVEQHRGKIWAENRPEGPMISFLLPLSGNGRNFTFDSTQEPKLVASVRRRPHWREIGASRPYAG
jgi:signal transduction histidine kinase